MRLLRPYADLDRDEFQSLHRQRWEQAQAPVAAWISLLLGCAVTAALLGWGLGR